MTDPAPDLRGDCPDDWDPRHWLAAQMINQGKTYEAVGAVVGVRRGTISGWVQKWRKRYGKKFLWQGRKAFTDEQRARAIEASSASTSAKWSTLREVAANENGVLAGAAREVAYQVLQIYLEERDRLLLLTPGDVYLLARSVEILERRADGLIGIPDATKAPLGRGRVSGDAEPSGKPPAGTLDALDGPQDDEEAATIAAAHAGLKAFLTVVPEDDDGGDDPPTETTGRKVG